MIFSYVFCGIISSLVSLFLLPKATLSLGASGAVFGLFAVSTLAKFSLRDLDWRKVVELAVLGEFVFRQISSEIATAADGGIPGINHAAHLSGAAAGAILVYGMQMTVANFDRAELGRLKKDRAQSARLKKKRDERARKNRAELDRLKKNNGKSKD